jgi:hypothetical protein
LLSLGSANPSKTKNPKSLHLITLSARASTFGGNDDIDALRCVRVDHQFELGRLLDRKLCRLRGCQNLADLVVARLEQITNVGAAGHEPAR